MLIIVSGGRYETIKGERFKDEDKKKWFGKSDGKRYEKMKPMSLIGKKRKNENAILWQLY